MSDESDIVIHWFRRDLRLNDNKALAAALTSGNPVLTVFIFDSDIISGLEAKDDSRITFIYDSLNKMNNHLLEYESSILIKFGKPINIWKELIKEYSVSTVFYNHDYEPYALCRDKEITDFLESKNINVSTFKDHVIFEKDEIVKDDGKPYTVFTPYKNKWFNKLTKTDYVEADTSRHLNNCIKSKFEFPPISKTGFTRSTIVVPEFKIKTSDIKNYESLRNDPAADKTSKASVHLRFGSISVRELLRKTINISNQYSIELAWREFFVQILYHFPHVTKQNFKKQYDHIQWRNNEDEFEKWCKGKTGYPLVDAGMNELNKTGFMHNRIRMVTASFLCKHLLIDWRWGEAYFASKLLDYDLSANNGNWQWSSGTGCDAAPYFRIFNPHTQAKRFDPENIYTRRWLPEFKSADYTGEIVEHTFARNRALNVYKAGIQIK